MKRNRLTRIGLQEHLSLSEDLLGPVLGVVCAGDQVLQVCVKLCLLSLAQLLFCELEERRPTTLTLHTYSTELQAKGNAFEEVRDAPNVLKNNKVNINPAQAAHFLWDI